MTEYSRMAKGNFTSTGVGDQAVILPFVPDYVEFLNFTASAARTTNTCAGAKWNLAMGQGFATMDTFVAGTAISRDNVITNGISTFEADLAFQFTAKQQIVSMSEADPCRVEVTGHGYQTGDVVLMEGLLQSATTGMQQIAGIPFRITRVDANNFDIQWDTSGSEYTALAASPTGARVKRVRFPHLYFPGVSYIEGLTLGATTTVDTTTAHNLVEGQEVAFRIPPPFGTTELNSLPNINIPGSPIYGFVVSVTDINTVVVNIVSTAFTAFDVNLEFDDFSGQNFAQMVAVGDVNSGGTQISSGSELYPPLRSLYDGTVGNGSDTINGPGVRGAFANNTRQGFIIGSGTGVTQTTTILSGSNADVIHWRAYIHDSNN